MIRNITWGKYQYRTILQLIIELIHFKVCVSVCRTGQIRTIKLWENIKLITQLIYFKICRCICRILSNITREKINTGQYYS